MIAFILLKKIHNSNKIVKKISFQFQKKSYYYFVLINNLLSSSE